MSTLPAAGADSAERAKVTVRTLAAKRDRGEPITMLTAYDYPTARVVDQAGIDSILVGDSLAMVVLGHENTLSVTMDEMLHHAKAVRRGTKAALVVGDMPFMSYQVSVAEAVRNAGRFVQEAGMEAVKLEGGRVVVPVVEAIVAAGIPVLGHVGLTPQSVNALGGWRVQGRTAAAAARLLDDALALEAAGCFAVVIESVPDRLATYVTERLHIPTIGIGAGAGTSGQVLVLHDLAGLFERFTPKFAKRYAHLAAELGVAVEAYRGEVLGHAFPAAEHSYRITEDEWQDFLALAREAEAVPAQGAALRGEPGVNAVDRVTVIGTGAMACLFGARLARSGRARVTLAGRWPAGLAALARDGVRVVEDPAPWSVRVAVAELGGPLAPAELVLVLVKSYQTAAVAARAAAARAADGLVLTLQNGLGNRAVLAAVAGAAEVAVGVTPVGATLVAPGVVRPGGGGETVLGATPATAARLAAVAELFRGAGLPSSVVTDIDRLVWRKLAVNAGINGPTALAGLPNGALLADPALAARMAAAAREVGAIAAAAGIDLGADAAELAAAVARATATNRSSMLQDLDRGAPTEVAAIYGEVVRAGRRLGVPVPVNEALWQALVARQPLPVPDDFRAAAEPVGSGPWTS